MTARTCSLRLALVAMTLATLVRCDARAAEPNTAPPLGSVQAAPLAPVPTDSQGITVVDPGAGSAQGSLAPQTLDAAETYYPNSGSYVYSEGETIEGEEYYENDFNPNEASVRISDLPAEEQGMYVPGLKPSKLLCPHCRYCEHGLPYHECPECDPTRKDIRKYTRKHGLRLPPDYGWAPPARAPIDRVSIDYYRAFPGCWTGEQAYTGQAIVRPQVYWPTDTTQLGYTYQHTPMWMCYPGMVPPVPAPGQWHLPLCRNCGPGYGCPHCQQHAGQPAPVNHNHAVPQQQWNPEEVLPQPEIAPEPELPVNQAAQLPAGPQLQPSVTSPSLAPIPF
jgi:hypothetical protein